MIQGRLPRVMESTELDRFGNGSDSSGWFSIVRVIISKHAQPTFRDAFALRLVSAVPFQRPGRLMAALN